MRNRWMPLLPIIGMLIFGLVVYNRLPPQVPTHWGLNGVADGFSSRFSAVLLLPALAVGLWVVLLALPRLDPRRAAYPMFEPTRLLFTNVIILFLAVVHMAALGAALGWAISIGRVITISMGLLFAVLGNEMARIRPNWFIGIRTPWTLANDEIWRRTHRVGGRLFFGLGLLMLLAGVFLPEVVAGLLIMISALGIVIFSFGYSYVLWRRFSQPTA